MQACPLQGPHFPPTILLTANLNSEGLGRESSMAGHFPPNSRVTGVKFFAAADMTMLPTLGLPVKKILSHFCCSSCSQTFDPPSITLMALESKYRGMVLARKEEQAGA
ncbi:hypothetical protein V8G54_000606 [Vigna mungo]|uniref:Uncharacterized protein n=1 Tax=Vigna mungo TaxID=3915 RepID=A0AAQ3P769_VIGMU